MARGEYKSATRYLREALTVAREVGDSLQLAMVLSSLRHARRSRGTVQLRACAWESAGTALLGHLGIHLPRALSMWVGPAMRAASEAFGPVEAEAAWSRGAAIPIDQVIEEALVSASAPESSVQPPAAGMS